MMNRRCSSQPGGVAAAGIGRSTDAADQQWLPVVVLAQRRGPVGEATSDPSTARLSACACCCVRLTRLRGNRASRWTLPPPGGRRWGVPRYSGPRVPQR